MDKKVQSDTVVLEEARTKIDRIKKRWQDWHEKRKSKRTLLGDDWFGMGKRADLENEMDELNEFQVELMKHVGIRLDVVCEFIRVLRLCEKHGTLNGIRHFAEALWKCDVVLQPWEVVYLKHPWNALSFFAARRLVNARVPYLSNAYVSAECHLWCAMVQFQSHCLVIDLEEVITHARKVTLDWIWAPPADTIAQRRGYYFKNLMHRIDDRTNMCMDCVGTVQRIIHEEKEQFPYEGSIEMLAWKVSVMKCPATCKSLDVSNSLVEEMVKLVVNDLQSNVTTWLVRQMSKLCDPTTWGGSLLQPQWRDPLECHRWESVFYFREDTTVGYKSVWEHCQSPITIVPREIQVPVEIVVKEQKAQARKRLASSMMQSTSAAELFGCDDSIVITPAAASVPAKPVEPSPSAVRYTTATIYDLFVDDKTVPFLVTAASQMEMNLLTQPCAFWKYHVSEDGKTVTKTMSSLASEAHDVSEIDSKITLRTVDALNETLCNVSLYLIQRWCQALVSDQVPWLDALTKGRHLASFMPYGNGPAPSHEASINLLKRALVSWNRQPDSSLAPVIVHTAGPVPTPTNQTLARRLPMLQQEVATKAAMGKAMLLELKLSLPLYVLPPCIVANLTEVDNVLTFRKGTCRMRLLMMGFLEVLGAAAETWNDVLGDPYEVYATKKLKPKPKEENGEETSTTVKADIENVRRDILRRTASNAQNQTSSRKRMGCVAMIENSLCPFEAKTTGLLDIEQLDDLFTRSLTAIQETKGNADNAQQAVHNATDTNKPRQRAPPLTNTYPTKEENAMHSCFCFRRHIMTHKNANISHRGLVAKSPVGVFLNGVTSMAE